MKFLIIFAVALFPGGYSQNNAYLGNNAYRQGNAYSQGNAFSQGNAYSQGNVNAQSNAYSQSRAYSQSYPSYPATPGSIYRPCPNFDRTCISQYFRRNSNCIIVNGQNAREPFYAPIRQYELPTFNVSLTRYDVEYFNILSGRIEEFFVDYASGYTVLSVNFRNLTVTAGTARYETNRRADIPLVEYTTTSGSYPEIAITTIFPSSNRLNLAQARSTGFILSTPIVRAENVGVALSAIYQNLSVAGRERLITAAPLTARNYIQSTICDFGIGTNDLGADR